MDIQADHLDLDSIFLNQRRKYNQFPYPDYQSRIDNLKTLRKIIINNQVAIINELNKDFGCRPAHETQTLEIFPCLETIDYAVKNLKQWLKPRVHKTSKWFWPSKSYVLPTPMGVVGIISPWNYPLFLTIAPLVAALAAGNRVLIKMSEHVPNFSILLKRLIETENCTVILGDAIVASEFSKLSFDHLFFTGSTQVGKKIMQAASFNLTRLTLELGGKSPVIIGPSGLKSDYVNKMWLGKIINAGQTCIAPDFICVPKGTSSLLLNQSMACEQIINLNISSDQYCAIINQASYNKLVDLISDAVAKGAIWHPLKLDDKNKKWCTEENNVYKIAPGLLLNVNMSMAVMQQEIFGPILPVLEYDNTENLLTTLQQLPRPLAIYLFTDDSSLEKDLICKTHSGAVNLNSTVIHAAQEALPFGGVGNSGFGCYRGEYGFNTFSHLKPVYKHSDYNVFIKFYPPVKRWQKMILNFMLK